MNRRFFSSESVTEGHPDKIADRISDAVLDALLRDDPHAHVACETFLTTGLVLVGGEISTEIYVDVDQIARRVIQQVGYDESGFGFNYQDCSVISTIKEQSSDIASAVREKEDDYEAIGAGDQGIMFGYACSNTKEMMPLPIVLAHSLTRRLAAVRKEGILPYLRPDGKSQVTLEYEDHQPKRATAVLIAAQHTPEIESERLRQDIITHVIRPELAPWLDASTDLLVNSSGRFVIGGPAADTGMTGRKVIVDTYGGYGSHGGGAFSGKDPTKVDRSGSYMARYVAKQIVAAGLAREVEVQIAYAIGRAAPLAINIDAFGTGMYTNDTLHKAVTRVFDFRPGAIINLLDLRRPIYEPFSCYGHFGRTDLNPTWERTDRVDDLKRALPRSGKIA